MEKFLCCQVNTLTSDKKAVWQNWGSLQGNMSLSTFWRIAKKHLRHYKGAESINDYCIYCYDLKTKVLPQVPLFASMFSSCCCVCEVALLLVHLARL